MPSGGGRETTWIVFCSKYNLCSISNIAIEVMRLVPGASSLRKR